MRPLTEILEWLDRTSKVSCPEITCDQAREVATLIREIQRPSATIVNQALRIGTLTAERDAAIKERDALKAAAGLKAQVAQHSSDGARCDQCLKVAPEVGFCVTHGKNFCRPCHKASGPAKAGE